MPSSVDTRFRDRAFSLLAAQFGEEIIYTTEGTPLTIMAIVSRGPLNEQGAEPDARYGYNIEITISQTDVPAPKIGADTAALLRRLSDASATTLRITALLAEDTGTWRLACN